MGQNPPQQNISQQDVKHDISPVLRDIPPPVVARGARLERREHPVRKLPPPPTRRGLLAPDISLQKTAARKLQTTDAVVFDGIGNGKNSFSVSSDPPDTNVAVGNTQFVEWVNTSFAVFDKTSGKPLYGPVPGATLWTGFGGNCEKFNDGDPIVQYDKAANRWVMTQFAISGKPFSQCIAVSTTADALGPYARYEYQFADFNDYPKFGVWPDGYYASFNMFRGNTFLGAKACAFERANMLTGDGARMKCFDVPDLGGLLPSDLDGQTAPPAGSPNYFLNFGVDQLNLWKFHVDWNNDTNSSFSGPMAINVSPFQAACDSCVPQPNSQEVLDTLSDRLMYRLSYRNFGDYEALFVNHTIAVNKGIGIRWYEVRNPRTTPKIEQQGTYAPDGVFRWMGSMATDKLGDIVMGYSASSNKISPSIRYTGRSLGDPLGTLAVEKVLREGKGSQETPSRWGDYSSVSLDPADDCSFWFTTQYLDDTGSFNWQTAVIRLRFPACK